MPYATQRVTTLRSSSRLVAMASLLHGSLLLLVLSLLSLLCASNAQMSTAFYARSCPNLETHVRTVMTEVVKREPRMAASILRLFFHDCFANACDGSILLDDSPGNFISEKDHAPNRKSVRGFDIIDAIKARVESVCNATVSCADILALSAREGVSVLGGPRWPVPLGRRDARRPSSTSNLPGPFASLSDLISLFAAKNLSPQDMTALSGAHTIGQAQCGHFRPRVFGDTNIDPNFASARKSRCPQSGAADAVVFPLDYQTPDRFDNSFFKNLVAKKGLLHSDQELFNGGSQDALVKLYSVNEAAFFRDFAAAMVKVGNINPLTGREGEIRLNCRRVN